MIRINLRQPLILAGNFEYLSGEDPFLGATLVGPVIRGIQEQGVIANGKHYVDNSQETARMQILEVVDERTQWEMYYPPFQAAVDAGLLSMMCSCMGPATTMLRSWYVCVCLAHDRKCAGSISDNKIKLGNQPEGLYACENPDTLQRDLKDRMGFIGFVVSDVSSFLSCLFAASHLQKSSC